MKYEAKITSIGESVLTFMKVRNSLILFNNDVPYAYENMVCPIQGDTDAAH